MTAYSLLKLSLVQRIRPETTRRPTVRLTARNSSVPRMAKLTDRKSIVPDDASPKEIAMMIQPLESSRMADATMIWPMSRRMKFISRTTMATILIDEIDRAVARNNAVTKRDCGSGRIESGSISPSAKPQMNGNATPAAATATAARPTRRTSRRSVSIPVKSNSIRMPSWETALIMLFCSTVCGNSVCAASGQSRPSTEGPSRTPPSNWPITAGWPSFCMTSPSPRPTSSRIASAPKKTASEAPELVWLGGKSHRDGGEQNDQSRQTAPRERQRRGRPPCRLAVTRRMQRFTPAD